MSRITGYPLQRNLTAYCYRLAFFKVASFSLLLFTSFANAQGTVGADLEVLVQDLRNNSGSLGCQIFASEAGFPRNNVQAFAAVVSSITAGTARCQFKNLAPGQYAVSVMHDENSNHKLDSNFLGVPTEGYGASNNKTYALSPPKWEESHFTLVAGDKKSLTIKLRY